MTLDDEQLPCRSSGSIPDALDMEGVGDIQIAFERPVSHGVDFIQGVLEQHRERTSNDDRTGADRTPETRS